MENENVYGAPEADLEVTSNDGSEFFVVSGRKLVIMSIITFGIYSLYFFYANWRKLNQSQGLSTWPAMRAIFAVFYLHSLCRYITTAKESKAIEPDVNLKSFALLYVLTFLLSFCISFGAGLVGAESIYFLTVVISVALLLVQTYALFRIQQVSNLIMNDSEGSENSSYGIGNILLIIFGIFVWIVNLAPPAVLTP